MSLRPDDKALAAYLMETEAVPLSDLARAMGDSEASARDLGDSLVRLGLLDASRVVGLRADVARRIQLAKAEPVTLELKAPFDAEVDAIVTLEPAAIDRDTWYDRPGEATPVAGMAGPVHALRFSTSFEIPRDSTTPVTDLRLQAAADDLEIVGLTGPHARGFAGWGHEAPSPDGSEDVLMAKTVAAGSFGGSAATAPAPPHTPFASPSWIELDADSEPIPETIHRSAFELLEIETRVVRPAPEPISGPSEERAASGEGVELQIEVEVEGERLAPSGKRLDERYQMLGEIGRGGMGRILKSHDTEIGREVAVKILLGGAQAPENMIRRFWMEVQATGQLEHPSIIPIHDVGRLPSGELFYVMKKLSGRTLADILADLRNTRANEAEFTRAKLLTLFQQIAYAVAFAHARGVIHRDVKPANIMVGEYGEAMLLDWGLAKLIDVAADDGAEEQPRVVTLGKYSASETASGTITGTPQYMSPEATAGQPELLTTKSDVYGLGAVLYEILTYEPAFADQGFVPTVVKVRKADFIPPRERAPSRGISVELEELCLLAMSKDPAERPAAKKLADDIGRILEGAKEKERRVAEAKARVYEGRKANERWKALKIELQSAESEAKRLAKEVPPWASVDKKEPMWALEDRVSELKIEAISAFEESEAAFLRALGEVPDDREARSSLASLYFARFGEAERARDVEAQRYYRNLVARYDDGVWARVMAGHGTLEVTASPDDVTVTLARMELAGRLLRPGEPIELGKVPIARFDVRIGSYLLTLRRPGDRDVFRPVLIGRTESVSVHVKYRSASEIGDPFIFIPEGPCILGGDPIAHGALDRRIAEVADFAIARFPVTCEEYLSFINGLARESPEIALRHVPRARAQEGHYWRLDPATGRFEYPERSPGGLSWVGNLPVSAISMTDAEAYIAWRASITGERLRLPNEIEWEKAARGVDGRFFPWGDHFDPTFCKMKESRDRAYPEPEPVGAFPTDRSPYGVRDMAGGMREICVTDEGGGRRPVVRGGCWSDTGLFCRVAFRHVTQPDFVNTGLGFRLVKDLD